MIRIIKFLKNKTKTKTLVFYLSEEENMFIGTEGKFDC